MASRLEAPAIDEHLSGVQDRPRIHDHLVPGSGGVVSKVAHLKLRTHLLDVWTIEDTLQIGAKRCKYRTGGLFEQRGWVQAKPLLKQGVIVALGSIKVVHSLSNPVIGVALHRLQIEQGPGEIALGRVDVALESCDIFGGIRRGSVVKRLLRFFQIELRVGHCRLSLGEVYGGYA